MKKIFICFLLFGTLQISAQQVKSATDNTAIPFVELYSNYGDFIGITDEDGTIPETLARQIPDSLQYLELVHPRYVTAKVQYADWQKDTPIYMQPVDYTLQEVDVHANKIHKYVCLTVYYRQIQTNFDRPHYVQNGVVKFYINQKNGKIKRAVECFHTLENKQIKQIKQIKVIVFNFVVCSPPHPVNYPYVLDVNNKFLFSEKDNGTIAISDKKRPFQIGTIDTLNNQTFFNLTLYTEEHPWERQGLGVESHIRHKHAFAVFSTNDISNIQFQNLSYLKDYRKYDVKQVKDPEFQKINYAEELFVLRKEYVDEISEEKDECYLSFNTKGFDYPIDHPYYQPWAEGVRKYIEENLTDYTVGK